MKKEIGLLLLLSLILISCKVEKKTVSDDKCKIVISPPSEDFESLYRNVDSSDFFKNELVSFNNVKNGIFYYTRPDGIQNRSFFILNIDNGYSALHKSLTFNKNAKISKEDQNKLNEILMSLKEQDYYQSCSSDMGHMTIYLLIIKSNNKKVRYFSFSGFPSQVKNTNNDFKLTREVFEIIYRNFYK